MPRPGTLAQSSARSTPDIEWESKVVRGSVSACPASPKFYSGQVSRSPAAGVRTEPHQLNLQRACAYCRVPYYGSSFSRIKISLWRLVKQSRDLVRRR